MHNSVTIVGAGHGGSAAAAFLAGHGFEVRMLKLGSRLHDAHFCALEKSGTIRTVGIEGEGRHQLSQVTRDPTACLPNSDFVLIFYVANYHEMVAKRIAPYLESSQIVYTCPGYLGSILIARAMHKLGRTSLPLLVEGETLPFSSRVESPGLVDIMSRNNAHPVATLPRSRCGEAVERLSHLFENVVGRNCLIEVALHNPNLIMHTLGTLLNITRVEDPAENFSMYRDGFSPTVWKFVEALDQEKMEVLRALGCEPRSYWDEFLLRTFGRADAMDPMDGFKHYANETPSGPCTMRNRYVTEDVPMGLGLLSSIGRELGVSTPVADILLDLASIAMGEDYREKARTIGCLGFENLEDYHAFVG